MIAITRFRETCEPFRVEMKHIYERGAQKVQQLASSIIFQVVIGFGLGLVLHKFYMPLTDRIIRWLEVSTTLPDPFATLSFIEKVLHTPLVCLAAPMMEEIIFRGCMTEHLAAKFEEHYLQQGLLAAWAKKLSCITAVFFASIAFGLMHFLNAIQFMCSPTLFLTQVVAATIMGFVFGLAKECTGDLTIPIGMHMGNNVLAWVHYLRLK